MLSRGADHVKHLPLFNHNQPGGCSSPPPPPLEIFRDKSAALVGLAVRSHEFFPYRSRIF